MNTQEYWERWQPLEHLSKKYTLDYITNTCKKSKFIVSLTDLSLEKGNVLIEIEEGVDHYEKITQEPMAIILKKLNEKYGSTFSQEWTFFKIHNSSFVQWLSAQSYNIWNISKQLHFALITTNAIVFFLSYDDEPKARLLKDNNLN